MSKAIIDRVNNSAWLGVQAEITPVSLTLPDNLSYEEWAEIGPRIARVKRFTTWALSDWLNYGCAKWGEMFTQAADTTGFEPNYLAIIKYVGASVEPSRRHQGLSFTHHRLVASLQAEEQEKLLADCEKNGWKHEEFRTAVNEFKKQIQEKTHEVGLDEGEQHPRYSIEEWKKLTSEERQKRDSIQVTQA